MSDSVSGLVWQKPVSGGFTLVGAQNSCNSLGAGWRLPTKIELVSLLDLGRGGGILIDTTFFSGTAAAPLGSASPRAGSASGCWAVDFGSGRTDWFAVSSFRCVRGSPLETNPQYDIAADTVRDGRMGLMWQKANPSTPCGSGTQCSWLGALAYCEGLPLALHDDWRLPTIKELQTLLLDSNANANGEYRIDSTAFPSNLTGDYWSSTPDPSSAANAYTLTITNSASSGITNVASTLVENYVRCVR